jgi:hypothetical protein
MDLVATILLTILLVVLVVLVHYEALLNASRLADRLTIRPRKRILVVIAAAFLAHVRRDRPIRHRLFRRWSAPALARSRASGRATSSISSTSRPRCTRRSASAT